MHSHRSDHSQQYSDRNSRRWDSYNEHRERHEPYRDVQWNSHHKYHGSTERTRKSREYSDSPKRLYSNDSLKRERSRQSPLRRHMSSPDSSASERKRRRFTEGVDDYRYRHGTDDRISRQLSPDSAHAHSFKDFKHSPTQEEGYKCRRTTQDSRHKHWHKDFTCRSQDEDLNSIKLSEYYRGRESHERSWDSSPERTQHQDDSMKYPETDITHQRAAVPGQQSAKGFQLFLDVLNKGVNVTMLNKIMTSAKENSRAQFPSSSLSTEDHPRSPNCTAMQELSHPNTRYRSEDVGSWRLTSLQSQHRSSFSPNGRSLSDGKSLQRCDGEQSYSSSSVESPSGVTPEDKYKHKQMQDVLQAIGMNLGFEELGQMSHRIQERLYGKRNNDSGHFHRGSRERDMRRALSPRPKNRSPSNRSSFSPSPQEYMVKDSYSFQRNVTEDQVHHNTGNSGSSILKDSKNCETSSRETTSTCRSFSQTLTYTSSEPPAVPVMPTYSPVNSPMLAYHTLPPNLPQHGPHPFLPSMPPFQPYPQFPPMNIFQQKSHVFPPQIGHLPFNLPIQPLNATPKSKTASRPRCLQVIETKQVG